jgi:hypothetical protein
MLEALAAARAGVGPFTGMGPQVGHQLPVFNNKLILIAVSNSVADPDTGWSNGRIRIRDKQTNFFNSLIPK